MTPIKKAKYLINRMNNKVIGYSVWQKASDYQKSDIKRKALIVVDEIENIGRWVGKEHAERNGYIPETTKEFWQEVRLELERF